MRRIAWRTADFYVGTRTPTSLLVVTWQQTSSVSLTVLHDDVQDFVSYVNGYYRLQVTGSDDDDDDDNDGYGLAVRTADQRSSSSSENGPRLFHYLRQWNEVL